MPRHRRRRAVGPRVFLTNQQAQGLFGDFAKAAAKTLGPIIKKEVKKALPGLGRAAGKFAIKQGRKTALGKRLGIGLKLAGAGPVRRRRTKRRGGRALNARGKQLRVRRRKPGVRVLMI